MRIHGMLQDLDHHVCNDPGKASLVLTHVEEYVCSLVNHLGSSDATQQPKHLNIFLPFSGCESATDCAASSLAAGPAGEARSAAQGAALS